MSAAGFSAEIHKVAHTDKRMALFLGMAFLFVWVVAVNIGVQDMTPRWFQTQFSWLADENIPAVFMAMAFASLVSAAGLWLFSGNGDTVFEITADGVTRQRLLGSTTYHWSDFELLERDVSRLILHLKPTAHSAFEASKIAFDLSKIDLTGPQLEALIVYYRPDLFRTLHLAHAVPGKDPAMATHTQPNAVAARSGPLADRLARLR